MRAEVVVREGWVGVVDYTDEQGVGKAVAEKGKEVLETVKERVGSVAEEVKEKVASGVDTAKDKVSRGVDTAKDRVARGVDTAKDKVARGLDAAKADGVNSSGSSDPLPGRRLLDLNDSQRVVEKRRGVLERVKEKVGGVAEEVRDKVAHGGVNGSGRSDPLAGKRLLDLK